MGEAWEEWWGWKTMTFGQWTRRGHRVIRFISLVFCHLMLICIWINSRYRVNGPYCFCHVPLNDHKVLCNTLHWEKQTDIDTDTDTHWHRNNHKYIDTQTYRHTHTHWQEIDIEAFTRTDRQTNCRHKVTRTEPRIHSCVDAHRWGHTDCHTDQHTNTNTKTCTHTQVDRRTDKPHKKRSLDMRSWKNN